MLTLISLLAAATAQVAQSVPIQENVQAQISAPIQVESTPARESSNKASGFGKHLDQSALASGAISVSTASIRPDGTVELSCETHRTKEQESAHTEHAK